LTVHTFMREYKEKMMAAWQPTRETEREGGKRKEKKRSHIAVGVLFELSNKHHACRCCWSFDVDDTRMRLCANYDSLPQ